MLSVDRSALSIYAFAGKQKGRDMGPFNTPWLTFLAWIVIGASILVSIGWSVFGSWNEGDE